MNKFAFYIAPDQACVTRVERRLALAGLPKGELSVLGVDGRVYGTRVLGGAAVCAMLGGIVGFILAWGLELQTATLGASELTGPGTSFALVIGLAVGAAAGSLTGSLIGLGIPSSRAQRLLRRSGRGSVLVAVHTQQPEDVLRTERLLADTGAIPVPRVDEHERHVAPARAPFASSAHSD